METHYVLFYDYVDDIVQRRGPHREAHLASIRAARDRGEVLMAGALGDPPHSAAIVFRGVEPEVIESFARDDPYARAGLIRAWRIERWSLV